MKKRLVSAAVTVALFIGLIAGVTFQSSDKKEIKHFTAFFFFLINKNIFC